VVNELLTMAVSASSCQSDCMAQPPENTRSGGIFIAIGGFAGVFMGRHYGQPTVGFISGLAIGGLLALLMWLKDRR
jgi:hypothetical protein